MKNKVIQLAHGAGGKLSSELMGELFLPYFKSPLLEPLNDQAVFDLKGNPGDSVRIALTTDSFVVSPLFFPGGDIGTLAVCGTVNDLSVGGARPLYLTAAFIIEEGTEIELLKRIVASMARTAEEAGVEIVTGDTKVVERGKADIVFINTAGVGVIEDNLELTPKNIRPGDKVILSGTIGDHGMTVLSERSGIEFEEDIQSDCAPLNSLCEAVVEAGGVRAMRDPTRGGLLTVLCEFAESAARVGIKLDESLVPVKDPVRGACELLGFDPMYVANEGKVVVVVEPGSVDSVLKAMRANKYGQDATVIGEVTESHAGKVVLKTILGTERIVEKLTGEQLPRIC